MMNMIRKSFCYLLIFAFFCTGCAASNLNSRPTDPVTASTHLQPTIATSTSIIPTSTTPTVSYNEPAILHINRVYHASYPEQTIIFNTDDTNMLLTLFGSGEWKRGNTQTLYEYIFECDNSLLRYSPQSAIFNDILNNRNFRITEEQRIAINLMIYNNFFAEQKVEPIAPPDCTNYIVELVANYYRFEYNDTGSASVISFTPKNQKSYDSIKYRMEHEEEYYNYTLEKTYDADRDAIVYRYTRGNGDKMMLVVYSIQTEGYFYTVSEEYVLDESETIPYSVEFLGANSTQYFLVQINRPIKPITKEWISMWGIKTAGGSTA